MYTYDALTVGQTFKSSHTITKQDVETFAAVTGDDNPIHVDEEYARSSRFGTTVVHGVLLLGIISKVLGRDFPGHGSVAVKLSARFLRPVPVGAQIDIEVVVASKMEKHRHVEAKVYIYCAGKMSLAGDATIIPPSGE